MHNTSKPDTFSMIPTSFFLWANDHFADFCLKESHCFDERSKDAETRLCPLGATCGETDGWASRRGGLWRWFGFRSQRIQRFFLYEFFSFIVLLFLFDLINVLHFIENMNPWEEVSKMTDPRRSHWICMCGRSYMLHWPRPEACGVLRISPASLRFLCLSLAFSSTRISASMSTECIWVMTLTRIWRWGKAFYVVSLFHGSWLEETLSLWDEGQKARLEV